MLRNYMFTFRKAFRGEYTHRPDQRIGPAPKHGAEHTDWIPSPVLARLIKLPSKNGRAPPRALLNPASFCPTDRPVP